MKLFLFASNNPSNYTEISPADIIDGSMTVDISGLHRMTFRSMKHFAHGSRIVAANSTPGTSSILNAEVHEFVIVGQEATATGVNYAKNQSLPYDKMYQYVYSYDCVSSLYHDLSCAPTDAFSWTSRSQLMDKLLNFHNAQNPISSWGISTAGTNATFDNIGEYKAGNLWDVVKSLWEYTSYSGSSESTTFSTRLRENYEYGRATAPIISNRTVYMEYAAYTPGDNITQIDTHSSDIVGITRRFDARNIYKRVALYDKNGVGSMVTNIWRNQGTFNVFDFGTNKLHFCDKFYSMNYDHFNADEKQQAMDYIQSNKNLILAPIPTYKLELASGVRFKVGQIVSMLTHDLLPVDKTENAKTLYDEIFCINKVTTDIVSDKCRIELGAPTYSIPRVEQRRTIS